MNPFFECDTLHLSIAAQRQSIHDHNLADKSPLTLYPDTKKQTDNQSVFSTLSQYTGAAYRHHIMFYFPDYTGGPCRLA